MQGARNQRLARARFATNQDRRVGRPDALDRLEQPPHGRAVANDWIIQLGGFRRNTLDMLGNAALDGGDELDAVAGPRQVIAGARLHGGYRLSQIGILCDQYDGCSGGCRGEKRAIHALAVRTGAGLRDHATIAADLEGLQQATVVRDFDELIDHIAVGFKQRPDDTPD